MVTYEITATVRADLCDAYEKYMAERHIPDVLDTGAFGGEERDILATWP